MLGLMRREKAVVQSPVKSTKLSEDFKAKLNLVLTSPQGEQIRSRNWRVSDKFVGGKPLEQFKKERDLIANRRNQLNLELNLTLKPKNSGDSPKEKDTLTSISRTTSDGSRSVNTHGKKSARSKEPASDAKKSEAKLFEQFSKFAALNEKSTKKLSSREHKKLVRKLKL